MDIKLKERTIKNNLEHQLLNHAKPNKTQLAKHRVIDLKQGMPRFMPTTSRT